MFAWLRKLFGSEPLVQKQVIKECGVGIQAGGNVNGVDINVSASRASQIKMGKFTIIGRSISNIKVNDDSIRIGHVELRCAGECHITLTKDALLVKADNPIVVDNPHRVKIEFQPMTPARRVTPHMTSMEDLGLRPRTGPIDSEISRRAVERFKQTQGAADRTRAEMLNNVKRSSTFNPAPPSNVYNPSNHMGSQIRSAATRGKDEADWERIRQEQRQREREADERRRRDDDTFQPFTSPVYGNSNLNVAASTPEPVPYHAPPQCSPATDYVDNHSNNNYSCPSPSYDNGNSYSPDNWSSPSPSNWD